MGTHFSPEILNRIDDIIVFRPLNREDLLKIGKMELEKLRERAGAIGIELEFTANAAESVSDAKNTSKFGARPIRRKAERLVENAISGMIVKGEIKSGDSVKVDIKDDKVSIIRKVTVQ